MDTIINKRDTICIFCKNRLSNPYLYLNINCEDCSTKDDISLVQFSLSHSDFQPIYAFILLNNEKYFLRLNILFNTTDLVYSPDVSVCFSFQGFPYHPDNIANLISKLPLISTFQ